MRLSLAFASPSVITYAPASRPVLARVSSTSVSSPSPSSPHKSTRLRRSSLAPSLSLARLGLQGSVTSSHCLPQPQPVKKFSSTICRQGITGLTYSASSYRARSPLATASGRSDRSESEQRADSMDDSSASPGAAFKFDSHLHVWASHEESSSFPYHPGQEPTIPGNVDFLLERMDAAGVSGALIIQPINHKFDHSYVSWALQSHPSRFIGCCLADPSSEQGVDDLKRLLTQDGYRAVRFNPYLWPQGEKMSNNIGCAMFSLAGELGAPVGFMCFKGLHLHIDDIRELCTRFPSTPVLMDHFGFCLPTSRKPEAAASWSSLLSLASFPQVYVKASAAFRVSTQPFPFPDVWPALRQLVDAFGADRVMWGSDFPFIEPECGYVNYWSLLHRPDMPLSSEEKNWLAGGTAARLFSLPSALTH